jgi:hypothetical protein
MESLTSLAEQSLTALVAAACFTTGNSYSSQHVCAGMPGADTLLRTQSVHLRGGHFRIH